MFGQIMFGIIGMAIGVALIVYSRFMVEQVTGSIGFAERYLGSGGTYNFYRILGVAVFIISLLVMFGIGTWIYDAIVNPMASVGNGVAK